MMTKNEIIDMQIKLNEDICRRVMGWVYLPVLGETDSYAWFPKDARNQKFEYAARSGTPCFCTDIRPAWDVVDKIGGRFLVERWLGSTKDTLGQWSASFGNHHGYGKTVPIAICRAALNFVAEPDHA